MKKQLGEQVDFISLDVDNAETKETLNHLGMRGRSHYMLIDADQNMIRQWRGVLNEESLAAEVAEELSKLGISTN